MAVREAVNGNATGSGPRRLSRRLAVDREIASQQAKTVGLLSQMADRSARGTASADEGDAGQD